MSNSEFIMLSGSAFMGNSIQATRPISAIRTSHLTNYVSLSEWCQKNFITKRVGYRLIAQKLLIGQKKYGRWWVCANPDCINELIDYLGIEQLQFDAEN